MSGPKIHNSPVPDTPLGYVAVRMTTNLPEGVRVIVMLTDEKNACTVHTKGYNAVSEPAVTILSDLVAHVGAVLKTFGLPPEVFSEALKGSGEDDGT